MNKLKITKINIFTRLKLWNVFFRSFITYGMEIAIMNGRTLERMKILFRKSIRLIANINNSSNIELF
jgi:hypothetical protein